MSEIKIQMQNNMGEIIHPETNANIVKYGNKSAAETLGELEARDRLFIQTSEPTEDGLWLDTTGTVDSVTEENIIATQIKKYIDEKVVTKVDKVESSNLDILAKIGDTTSLETDIKDNLVGAVNEHEVQINNNTKQVSNLSNPNLLINGDFRNPVNQRGKTIYNEYGKYTIDRWMLMSDTNATIEVLNDCIRFKSTNNGSWSNLTTYLEVADIKHLLNKNVTMTLKTKTPTKNVRQLFCSIKGGTQFLGLVFDYDYEATDTFTATFKITDVSGFLELGCQVKHVEGAYIDIEYIKLEIGTQATPFVPRPYAEELTMCQRYYQNDFLGRVQMRSTDDEMNFALVGFLQYITTMRTKPTLRLINGVSLTDKIVGAHHSMYYTPTQLDYFGESNCSGAHMGFVLTGNVSKRNGYYTIRENIIEADAEIY